MSPMARSPRRLALIVAGAVLAALLVAAAWVPIPYYAVGPGPTRNVLPYIQFQGPTRYDTTGSMSMTTVRYYQVTPLQAFTNWLDPNWAVVNQDVLYPGGTTVQQDQTRAVSDMDQSKIDATYVVLSRLTKYPKDHGPGVLVEGTAEGCPAYGHLFAGDVITEIDGTAIGSRAQAVKILNAADASQPLHFTLDVDGKTEHATFTKAACGANGEALVGVVLIPNFPFPVQISSGDVGGPSAGLMYALGLYELMTPGELTHGRAIAGTGTIGLDGTVGPIGGIRDKVVGAERAGATLFLVPKGNMAELRGVDTGGMRLVSVGSFDEALQALRGASTSG
jgi:PDZ domain-containing protein